MNDLDPIRILRHKANDPSITTQAAALLRSAAIHITVPSFDLKAAEVELRKALKEMRR